MNTHHVANLLPHLSIEELEILNERITGDRMRKDINRYSGQIESRHVSHPGNIDAVVKLLVQLYKIGKGRFWIRLQRFRLRRGQDEQVCVNVEARLPGMNSPHVVIIAAHLDSTASRDPFYRPEVDPAPGADDDASGIGGVLAAARAIVALSREQQPRAPRAEIRFTLFNAEEQAQRGSRVYAKREKKQGASISAVYQMDMIGYRRGNDNNAFEIHAGFRKNADVQAASLDVAHHMVGICAAVDIPLMPQVYFHRARKRDPGQGFSDHSSFHRNGFPAILVSENFFPGQGPNPSPAAPNPDYHLPEDTRGKLNPEYAANIARVVAAAAWHRATRIDICPSQKTDAHHQHDTGGNEHGGNVAHAGSDAHHDLQHALEE